MIYLVAPEPNSFISGGNLFNQQILDGLAYLGLNARSIDFPAAGQYMVDPNATLIFDSIYVDLIQPSFVSKGIAQKIFLIHLLPSMLDPAVSRAQETELLNRFDIVIVNSQFTLDYCQFILKLEKKPVLVQPYILAVKRQEPIKRRKIMHVANWVPEKRILELLIEMAKQTLPASFMIYFYGDEKRDKRYYLDCKSILDECPQLKAHVAIMGPIAHEDLLMEYQSAHVLIDTSSMETYGMAVAEALANGVSVISLGQGNVYHLLKEGRGMICKDMTELLRQVILREMENTMKSANDLHSDHTLVKDEIRKSNQHKDSIITEWNDFVDQLRVLPLH